MWGCRCGDGGTDLNNAEACVCMCVCVNVCMRYNKASME